MDREGRENVPAFEPGITHAFGRLVKFRGAPIFRCDGVNLVTGGRSHHRCCPPPVLQTPALRMRVFSAKGAVSSQPGATPQELVRNWRSALKARLKGRGLGSIRQKLNRAFSAGVLVLHTSLGRCPRLLMIAAPLALNRRLRTAKRLQIRERVLMCADLLLRQPDDADARLIPAEQFSLRSSRSWAGSE